MTALGHMNSELNQQQQPSDPSSSSITAGAEDQKIAVPSNKVTPNSSTAPRPTPSTDIPVLSANTSVNDSVNANANPSQPVIAPKHFPPAPPPTPQTVAVSPAPSGNVVAPMTMLPPTLLPDSRPGSAPVQSSNSAITDSAPSLSAQQQPASGILDPSAINAAVAEALRQNPESDEIKREQMRAMYLAGFRAAAQAQASQAGTASTPAVHPALSVSPVASPPPLEPARQPATTVAIAARAQSQAQPQPRLQQYNGTSMVKSPTPTSNLDPTNLSLNPPVNGNNLNSQTTTTSLSDQKLVIPEHSQLETRSAGNPVDSLTPVPSPILLQSSSPGTTNGNANGRMKTRSSSKTSLGPSRSMPSLSGNFQPVPSPLLGSVTAGSKSSPSSCETTPIVGPTASPTTSGHSNPFPRKLMEILESEDPTVVGWMPQGNAFIVRDAEKFVKDVLQRYFRHSKVCFIKKLA